MACFYDPVFCGYPPLVKNATVKTNSSRPSGHFLNDTAEYSCEESFEMVGNRNIICTYRGQWTTPPQCLLKPIIKSKLNPLPFVLPIIIILLLLLVLIFAVRYKIKLREK